jgi:hypothetical protein
MAYWMIYTREPTEGEKYAEPNPWAPQFGDKDEECVRQERLDSYQRQFKGEPGKYPAYDIRIVKFKRVPQQREVDAVTVRLNRR